MNQAFYISKAPKNSEDNNHKKLSQSSHPTKNNVKPKVHKY